VTYTKGLGEAASVCWYMWLPHQILSMMRWYILDIEMDFLFSLPTLDPIWTIV